MVSLARRFGTRSLMMLAAAGVLVGCGQEEAGTGAQDAASPPEAATEAAPADDESAVTQTVVTYFNALAGRDFATACLQLSPQAQEDVGKLVQIPGDCEDAMETAFEGFSDQELADLRDVPISTVEISGDTATVSIEGATGPVPLERSGGTWLISEFAGA